MADRREIVAALLRSHGRTYAEELGIDLAGGGPSALFRMLCAAVLFAARINADIAVAAARALADRGWTTARDMAEATWAERARILNRAGYARYDERTSTMLGDTAELLVERYGGDLRRLREQAGRRPDEERRLLKQCKGIGDVGVDIFFRETQASWEELRPFLDRRALAAAGRLGLGQDGPALAGFVDEADVARLAAALVRVELGGDHEAVLRAAGGEDPGRNDGATVPDPASATKADLYRAAQRLDLPGRSRMSKRELAEAVRDHTG